VGPNIGLDTVAKRKISHHSLWWELNTDRPTRNDRMIFMMCFSATQ